MDTVSTGDVTIIDDTNGVKTLYVDASAQYNLTDKVKLIVELQNITDEQNRLFIDATRNDTLFETRVGRTITFGATARF